MVASSVSASRSIVSWMISQGMGDEKGTRPVG